MVGSSDKSLDLMNPKTMDGPVISNTVADQLKFNPTLFMTYHVVMTPFGLFNTAGVVLGCGLYYTVGGILYRYFPPSALATMGTTGLVAGGAGAVLGLTALTAVKQKGETAEPPWNESGIQQRTDGLSNNYKVRALDVGVWTGLSLTAGALLLSRGNFPIKMWGLSTGLLGIGQALSIGAAIGGLGAFASIYKTLPPSATGDDE